MSAFDLTSTSLVMVVAVLAVALPVVLVLTWGRHPHGIGGGAFRLIVVLACQVLAVAGVGLVANNSFGFYNSWSDLLGSKAATAPAATSNELVPADGSQGKIVSMSVPMSGRSPTGHPGRSPSWRGFPLSTTSVRTDTPDSRPR